MPRKRIASKRRADLGLQEVLELLCGNGGQRSHFASEAARREAWRYHRAELLATHPAGCRPWAWWQYDAPGKRRELGKRWVTVAGNDGYESTEYEAGIEFLVRHRLATEADIASLRRSVEEGRPHEGEHEEGAKYGYWATGRSWAEYVRLRDLLAAIDAKHP